MAGFCGLTRPRPSNPPNLTVHRVSNAFDFNRDVSIKRRTAAGAGFGRCSSEWDAKDGSAGATLSPASSVTAVSGCARSVFRLRVNGFLSEPN
jgi:hypothetical protein